MIDVDLITTSTEEKGMFHSVHFADEELRCRELKRLYPKQSSDLGKKSVLESRSFDHITEKL